MIDGVRKSGAAAEYSADDACKFTRPTPYATGNSLIFRSYDDHWEAAMPDATAAYVRSNLVVRVAFYSLGAAVLVFVAMLLMAGVHPW
jgi:hypothetical protein